MGRRLGAGYEIALGVLIGIGIPSLLALAALAGFIVWWLLPGTSYKLTIENQTDHRIFVFAQRHELTTGYAFLDSQATRRVTLAKDDPPEDIVVALNPPEFEIASPPSSLGALVTCRWEDASSSVAVVVTTATASCVRPVPVSPP